MGKQTQQTVQQYERRKAKFCFTCCHCLNMPQTPLLSNPTLSVCKAGLKSLCFLLAFFLESLKSSSNCFTKSCSANTDPFHLRQDIWSSHLQKILEDLKKIHLIKTTGRLLCLHLNLTYLIVLMKFF